MKYESRPYVKGGKFYLGSGKSSDKVICSNF